jgi:hypothetical protein
VLVLHWRWLALAGTKAWLPHLSWVLRWSG